MNGHSDRCRRWRVRIAGLSTRYAAIMGLMLTSIVAAQEQPATAVAPPVKVRTRVLPIREAPLPEQRFLNMSTAISRDGRRVVVGISSSAWFPIDEKGPEHPSSYLYDGETDKSLELEPVIEGRTWRLVGNSAMSPDGRFVAAACVPVTGEPDPDARMHCSTVALVDTTGGESRLIDLKTLGILAPIANGAPAISQDGSFVAIPTTPDFGNGIGHGWSRETNTVHPVMLEDDCYLTNCPSLSDDGRFLAVDSFCKSSATESPGAVIFDLRSDSAGETARWPGGRLKLNDGWGCSLSGDGKRVAFKARAAADASGARPGDNALFVYDDTTRSTTLVSGRPGETFSTAMTLDGGISRSGAYVAFVKGVDPPRGHEGVDPAVYVRELSSGRTARVSGERAAGRPDRGFCSPSVSDDGRRVVFFRIVSHDAGHGLWEDSTEAVLADIDWSAPDPVQPH